MSEPGDGIFADPSVQFLSKLLDEFARGEIQLPQFQRPFVWDKARRLKLFDSVRKRIPIGSLMLWETRATAIGQSVATPKTELGPFSLPRTSEQLPRRLLLDGEQRLLTLFFALHSPSPSTVIDEGEERPDAFEMYFDLDQSEFLTKEDLGRIEAHHFPLRAIFQSRAVLNFQRELTKQRDRAHAGVEGAGASADEQLDARIARTDEIVEAFRQYKIPVTVMKTDDLALATETFKRVNSQGAKMTEVHMTNAVAWQPGFDLLDEFSNIREAIDEPVFWRNPEHLVDDVLLRVCKRLVGADVYGEDVSQIALRLRDRDVLHRVGRSMQRAARFLAARAMQNPYNMPNTMQLVVLGVVFDSVPAPETAALDRLEDWLWFTSYAESFGRLVRGATYEGFETQALAFARGDRPAKPRREALKNALPRFDFRAARSKTLAWNLARRAQPVDGSLGDVLAEASGDAIVRVVDGRDLPLDLSSRSAARVLWSPLDVQALRANIREKAMTAALRTALVLSDEACDHFAAKRFEEFIRLREAELNHMEEQHFIAVRQRLFGSDA